MFSQSTYDYPSDKRQLYAQLQKELAAMVEGEWLPIPNLANAAALLWHALKDINWCGFYLMVDKGSEGQPELVLGPFQGKPACIRIKVGKGVCGTAVAHNKTQVVDNVHEFPGHIACDSASNSEIVVPLRNGDKIVGVLDIDSPVFARFDAVDQEGLEALARILERACEW
ncbi:MAG TPA: GAF domain-containing protein [Firmicutes bacterium]|nr:GAF domain-containing protein [Candidatus Fermentithermobacillaceae bacterium]